MAGKVVELAMSGTAEFPEEILSLIGELSSRYSLDLFNYVVWCIKEHSYAVLRAQKAKEGGGSAEAEDKQLEPVISSEEFAFGKEDRDILIAVHKLMTEMDSRINSLELTSRSTPKPTTAISDFAGAIASGDSEKVAEIASAVAKPAGQMKFNLKNIQAQNKAMSGSK